MNCKSCRSCATSWQVISPCFQCPPWQSPSPTSWGSSWPAPTTTSPAWPRATPRPWSSGGSWATSTCPPPPTSRRLRCLCSSSGRALLTTGLRWDVRPSTRACLCSQYRTRWSWISTVSTPGYHTLDHFPGNNHRAFHLIPSFLNTCTLSLSPRHRCEIFKFNFIPDKPVISLNLGLGIDQDKITGNLSSWLSFFNSPGLTAYFVASQSNGIGVDKRHKNCQDPKLKINLWSWLENIFLRGIWCVSGVQGPQSARLLRCLLDERRKLECGTNLACLPQGDKVNICQDKRTENPIMSNLWLLCWSQHNFETKQIKV